MYEWVEPGLVIAVVLAVAGWQGRRIDRLETRLSDRIDRLADETKLLSERVAKIEGLIEGWRWGRGAPPEEA